MVRIYMWGFCRDIRPAICFFFQNLSLFQGWLLFAAIILVVGEDICFLRLECLWRLRAFGEASTSVFPIVYPTLWATKL